MGVIIARWIVFRHTTIAIDFNLLTDERVTDTAPYFKLDSTITANFDLWLPFIAHKFKHN